MNQNIKYRPEIDGLRAIAVLSVVVFHGFPNWLPGGFVGVDVFFVISGFLITKILHQDIDSGGFSLRQFYLRRIKRILPAYIVVCLAVVVVGSILLIPDDYVYFTTSLSASWVFASNIFFSLLSGGYFSQRTETFPLLHTWSLSVEEQFYFFFPLILLFWSKISKKSIFPMLIVLFLLFLCLSEYGAGKASGFYLLQYRAHELLIGSIVHFASLRRSERSSAYSQWIVAAGIAMIAFAIIAFSGKTKFPGLNTLVPCLGAAFVLYGSGVAGNRVNNILGSAVPVFFGQISYSLYLWHWPIFAFLKVYEIPVTLAVGLCAILGAISLGYLSWRFIENPVRRMSMGFGRAFAFIYVVPAIFFLSIGAASYWTKGLPARFSSDTRALMSTYGAERDLNRACSIRNEDVANVTSEDLLRNCTFGAKAPPQVLMFGDSHASHFKPFVNELATDAGLGVAYHVQGNCNSIDLEQSAINGTKNSSCRKRNEQLFGMAGDFKYVVLASNWRYRNKDVEFEKHLTYALDQLRHSGVKVILFKDNPATEQDLSRCILNQRLGRLSESVICNLSAKEVLAVQDGMDRVIDRVSERYSNVVVVSPKKVMCDEFECFTHKGNVAFYRDSNHINELAAAMLGRDYIRSIGNPFRQ